MSSEKNTDKSLIIENLSQYEFLPIDSCGIIFSSASHNIHILDELSTLIWEMYVFDRVSIKIIGYEIASIFDVPVEIARQDVQSTIRYWISMISDMPYQNNKLSNRYESTIFTDIYQNQLYLLFPKFSLRVSSTNKNYLEEIRLIFNHLCVGPILETIDYDIYIVVFNEEYLICLEGEILEVTHSAAHIPVIFHRAVTELACQNDEWISVLHAAGVSYRNQAIVFPSLGGSGKSTLTAVLVQFGFEYLNDDVVPLLKNKRLVPIPVSLCIKSGSWSVLKKWYPFIDDLKTYGRNDLEVKYLQPPVTHLQHSTVRAKYLVAPKYSPNISGAELKPITSLVALKLIVESESLIEKPFSKSSLEALIEWIQSIRCYTLEYSNLSDAVNLVEKLVGKV